MSDKINDSCFKLFTMGDVNLRSLVPTV